MDPAAAGAAKLTHVVEITETSGASRYSTRGWEAFKVRNKDDDFRVTHAGVTVRWLLIGLRKKLPADPMRKWGRTRHGRGRVGCRAPRVLRSRCVLLAVKDSIALAQLFFARAPERR